MTEAKKFERKISYNGLDLCFRKDYNGMSVDVSGELYTLNEFLHQLDEQYLHPVGEGFRKDRMRKRLNLLNYVNETGYDLTGPRICYKNDWICHIDKLDTKVLKITLTQSTEDYERKKEMAENVCNAVKAIRSEEKYMEDIVNDIIRI